MLPIVINFLLAINLIVSLLIILLVLMQRPKNEGLGAAFGGGMTENLFGAQTTNVLQTITRWLGGLFFALTLVLSWLYVKKDISRSTLQQRLSAPTVIPATPAPAISKDVPTTLPEAFSAEVKAPTTEELEKMVQEAAKKGAPLEAPKPAPGAPPAPAPEAAKPMSPAPDAPKPAETPKSETPAPAPTAAPEAAKPLPAPETAKPVPAPEAAKSSPTPEAAMPAPAPGAAKPEGAPKSETPAPAPAPSPEAAKPAPAPGAAKPGGAPVPAPEKTPEPAKQ